MDDNAFELAEREFMNSIEAGDSSNRLIGAKENVALKLTMPDFQVQGPSRAYDFWTTERNRRKGELGVSHSLHMRINRSGMGYPDSWYVIADGDLREVIETWKDLYDTFY